MMTVNSAIFIQYFFQFYTGIKKEHKNEAKTTIDNDGSIKIFKNVDKSQFILTVIGRIIYVLSLSVYNLILDSKLYK